MKIIFLDIDGPMIPDQVSLLPKKERFPLKKTTGFPYHSKFSPYSIGFIRQLVTTYDAKIVTCSTHNHYGDMHILDLFAINGMPRSWLHEDIMTEFHKPGTGCKERDVACVRWLLGNLDICDGFVIIDDALENEYDETLWEWGIKASYQHGLVPTQLREARQIMFNRKKTGFTMDDIELFQNIL
jgi:hypothetical protein